MTLVDVTLADPERAAPGWAHTVGWLLTWRAGPDAGASMALGPGRYVIGRAPQAHVRCDDPLLAAFHAEVVLGSDGTWTVQQVAGRTPLTSTACEITVGASVIRLVYGPLPPSLATGSTENPNEAVPRQEVIRSPRAIVPWAPEPLSAPPSLELPDAHRPAGAGVAGALAPAAVACGAAVVMALVMHQAVMALFATVGLLASGVGVVVQLATERARRRAAHARAIAARAAWQHEADLQREAWATFQRSAHGSAPERFATALAQPPKVWQRRPEHGDAMVVALGEGTRVWHPVATPPGADRRPLAGDAGAHARECEVPDLPVPLAFDPGAVVLVRGIAAAAVARSLVVQLACQTGPADWRLIVVTSTPAAWSWALPLPHLAHPEVGVLVLDERGLGDLVAATDRIDHGQAPHTVIIIDEPALLTVRTGPLRRLLASSRPPAVLAVANGVAVGDGVGDTVPAVCTAVVHTRRDGWARVVTDTSRRSAPVMLRYVGVGVGAAERLAIALGRCCDPEDPRQAAAAIPTAVSLVDVLRQAGTDPLDPHSITATWLAEPVDPRPATPLGRTADSRIDIDLVADGPHGLIAGTTGAGKSELLRSLVVGLAARLPPEHVAFVLIDYKGGATFNACARLPHVAGVVTDLDGRLAERVLRSLRAELARREQQIRTCGVPDLTSARRQGDGLVFARLVVVVDEFAALAAEQPEFLHALVGVAQRGRSLGVHLVLATQRPAGVINDDIRANTQLRLALRLHDQADALDVVGDVAPARLPRRVPGRAVLRLGADELVTFQTASTGHHLPAMVDAICAAAEQHGSHAAPGPWSEPLPNELAASQVEAWIGEPAPPGTVGVVDLPDEQRREPLRWQPVDGHLLVVGSPGAGVTSTLGTVASTLSTDFVVIDANGDASWDGFLTHGRCMGVIRIHERERLWRALATVATALDHHDGGPPLVVVIDGITALRRELDDLDRLVDYEVLERLLAHGGGRVVAAVGAEATASLPGAFLARCATRWVLHLHDRSDAAFLGVPAPLVPPPIAGRLVVAARAAEAQVVVPAPPVAAHEPVAPARRIGQLGHRVDEATLPRSTRDDGSWRPVVGIDACTLDVAVGDVPDGEHVVVLGPARTGRTTTLVRLATAWRDAEPAGFIGVLAPRAVRCADMSIERVLEQLVDRTVEAAAAGRRCLLVIDDAERVGDASGRLTALLASADPAVTVVAAGRADALRQAYGHWSVAVRRSRLGVVSAAAHDLDGDLLGVALPRRLPITVRAGLVHLVDHAGRRLVQVANSSTGVDPTGQLIELARAGSLQV